VEFFLFGGGAGMPSLKIELLVLFFVGAIGNLLLAAVEWLGSVWLGSSVSVGTAGDICAGKKTDFVEVLTSFHIGWSGS